jgi:hypothetical protein
MVTWCTGRPRRAEIGGHGHFRLGPAPSDARERIGLDRRDALERQRARHPDNDLAHDLGAAGPEPDRLDSGHAPGVDDGGADVVGQTLGRAIDERVDRRLAQAKAGDRDEAGDADGGQRVGVRKSGPNAGKA